MTSPPNLMEIISKGNIEMYASDHEQQPPITRHRLLSSCSLSHHENLQSLESLPPDEPSVMTIPSTCTTTSDCSTEMLSDSMTDSSSVYARIHQLADAVKREVTAMENIRSGVEGEKESSVEIKAAQYDKMSQGSVIEERKRKGMEESDLEMAAKVKRALAKMRHLDSRLADLSKKEKEVKRQRLALEQQADLQSDSRSSSTLPPVESMAVFPTQPLYHSSSELQSVDSQDSMVSEQTEEVESTPDSKKGRAKLDHNIIVSDDSFIKRNIQLASDAGSIIAMTEEEKKRLEQLLTNDDEDDEMSGNEEEGVPHNMELIPAGFTFSEDDMEKLKDIDSRLQNIVPALQWPTTPSQNDLTSEQAESVSESDGKTSPSTTTTTHQAGPGEAVLLMLQTDREASNRLHQIETMLNHIQASRDQQNTDSNPPQSIDYELLQELLKQCRDEQSSSSQLSQYASYHE